MTTNRNATKASLSRRVNQLEQRVDELSQQRDASRDKARALADRIDTMKAENDAVVSELKGMVAGLREENANLRGYLRGVADERRPQTIITQQGPHPEEDRTPTPLKHGEYAGAGRMGGVPKDRVVRDMMDRDEKKKADWFDL